MEFSPLVGIFHCSQGAAPGPATGLARFHVCLTQTLSLVFLGHPFDGSSKPLSPGSLLLPQESHSVPAGPHLPERPGSCARHVQCLSLPVVTVIFLPLCGLSSLAEENRP